MIRVEPFAAEHLNAIAVQPAQLRDWPDCAERAARGAVFAGQKHGNSFFDEAGRVIACFGMVESHPQHLTAWSVLAALDVCQLRFATRWCRAYLNALAVRRIDIFVRASFLPGNRWAALLGFGREGAQQAFFPDGDDLHVWARIAGLPAPPRGA